MSILVKNLLSELDLIKFTTKSDRESIDREIEKRKGCNCDEAIYFGIVPVEEFEDIVYEVIGHFKEQKIIIKECEKDGRKRY